MYRHNPIELQCRDHSTLGMNASNLYRMDSGTDMHGHNPIELQGRDHSTLGMNASNLYRMDYLVQACMDMIL